MDSQTENVTCPCCSLNFNSHLEFWLHDCHCDGPVCKLVDRYSDFDPIPKEDLLKCSLCDYNYVDLVDYVQHSCSTQAVSTTSAARQDNTPAVPMDRGLAMQTEAPELLSDVMEMIESEKSPQGDLTAQQSEIESVPSTSGFTQHFSANKRALNDETFLEDQQRNQSSDQTTKKRKKFYCKTCNKGLSTSERLLKHKKTCNLSLLAPEKPDNNTIANFVLTKEAFKEKYRLYHRDLYNCFTLEQVGEILSSDLRSLISQISDELGPLKISFTINIVFEKAISGEEVDTHIHSIFKKFINEEDDMEDLIKESFSEMQAIIDHYTERGSGFVIVAIKSMEIYVAKYQPHQGGCGFGKLPQIIAGKKCCLTVKSKKDCFMYAVLAGLYRKKTNQQRASQYKKFIKCHDFSNWRGEVSIDQLKKFEKANSISVSVFSYNLTEKYIIPLRVTSNQLPHHVKLFLHGNHYYLITHFSRLLNSRTNYRRHHCERCLHGFRTKGRLAVHMEDCKHRAAQRVVMPSVSRGTDHKERNNLVRRNLNKEIKHPFVIYADFECISLPTDDPVKVRRHKPTSYGYCVVDWNKTIIKSEFGHGVNVINDFYKSIKSTEVWLASYLKENGQKLLRTDPTIEFDFTTSKNCWICKGELLNDRVKDHCHLTGEYRGVAHNECNLNYRLPKRIPVLFHNLKNYDGHLLIEGINSKIFNSDITLIPQTMEKYIGWFSGNFAFLDSYAFLPASLDTLSKDLSLEEKTQMLRQYWRNESLDDLCGKAALPYEYLDSFDKYSEDKLPPIESFYSSLTDSNITDDMYKRLERIWKQFKCETMKDIIDIYLKLDVFMLAAVFENFRDTSIKDFGIDPPHYMSVPGFSYNSAIKMLGIELELFTEIDMYIMIENGIRGGFTTTVKRHAVADNPAIATYESGLQTWLLYLDVNNLYGHAMMQMLPIGEYKWVRNINFDDIMETADDSDKGYILEVDMEYPNDLHDAHNDFPLAPHKMKITEEMLSPYAKELLEKIDYKPKPSKKLVATFLERKNYVVHYRVLKYYISMGLKVKHVHRVIVFRQERWLKPFIEFCTEKRKQASSPFISSLYKLFVNSNYGKLMEDKRKRVKVDLVMSDAMAARRVRNNFCKSMRILDEEKVLFQMIPDSVFLDKPIIVGFTVLELAKLHVYNLYYGDLKAYYRDNLNLIYSDTDSLLIEIKTNNLNVDMKKFESIMDFSDLPRDHPLYSDRNKKKIGCLKDEMSGSVIEEVIAIRPKLYAVKTSTGEVKKKAKGVQQVVVKNKLSFEDYRNSLFSNGVIKATTRRLGSESHRIYQYVNEKIALSPFEDKRYLLDSINSLAYGHYKIKRNE